MAKSLPEIEIKPPPPITMPPEPHPRDLDKLARNLIESKRPIIIAEHAGEYPEAVSKLTELAEMLSIPVFESTNPSFANFPKNHPLHMGYDASEALKEADTVFIVRSTTPWYPPSSLPQNGIKVLLMDEVPWHEKLPYWGYQTDISITADIRQGLAKLVDIVRQNIYEKDRTYIHHRERFEYWRIKHERMAELWETEALAGQQNKPISSRWFFHIANKVLPNNSIILDETILHSRFIKRYLAEPGRYFRISYGALGVGLGEAAGLKLAYQDRPVIFLVGDGAFNYSPVLAGLGLCQEYNLPVLTIVANNGGYMAMRHNHNVTYPAGWAAGHNAYLGASITPRPDYATVAKAFDAYGERLEDPGDIESTLNRALQQISRGRAALLDVILDARPQFIVEYGQVEYNRFSVRRPGL